MNAIMNMTKEDYVIGLDSKTSFAIDWRMSYKDLGICMDQHLINLVSIMARAATTKKRSLDGLKVWKYCR